jgi:hypothetical protein
MFGRTDECAPARRARQLEGLASVEFDAWMRRPVAALLRAAATSRGLALEPATPCWCRTVLQGARAGMQWCDTPRAERPSIVALVPERPELREWLLGFHVATCWEPVRLGLLAMCAGRPASHADEAAVRHEVSTTLHVLDAMDDALGLQPGESTVASALLFAHAAIVWRRRCDLLGLEHERATMLQRTRSVAAALVDAVPAARGGGPVGAAEAVVLQASIELLARECDDEHLHPIGFGQIFE